LFCSFWNFGFVCNFCCLTGIISQDILCLQLQPSYIYTRCPFLVSTFTWKVNFFYICLALWILNKILKNNFYFILLSLAIGSFFCGTGVWTQGFVLAKQVLYYLSHASSPFCSGYFEDRIFWTICPGWPWISVLLLSASQIARIIGMSHWHSASYRVLNKSLMLYP
jgi:hypothetical protein